MPTPAPPYSAILFDLDGTIIDSAPGILASLEYALERMGMRAPREEELVHWIGPPILDAFRDQAGLDEKDSQRALVHYRRHYVSHGVYVARVYPGMAELLAAVHATGVQTSLATSKPENTARLVLDHFDLSGNFTHLTGASEDEARSSKEDVILEALRRLRGSSADLSNPMMIGDRHHDVGGALTRGLPAIWVGWGYGLPSESAGAVASAHSVDELAALLGVLL